MKRIKNYQAVLDELIEMMMDHDIGMCCLTRR